MIKGEVFNNANLGFKLVPLKIPIEEVDNINDKLSKELEKIELYLNEKIDEQRIGAGKKFNETIRKVIEDLELEVDSKLLELSDYKGKLRIKILNKIKQYLEEIWEKSEYYFYNKKINAEDSIENYLVDRLTGNPINIRFPQNIKKNKIYLSDNVESKDINYQNVIRLKLITKIPIYITDHSLLFSRLNQAIKTEFLSNNILQKIYYSLLNDEKNLIIMPNDYFIQFYLNLNVKSTLVLFCIFFTQYNPSVFLISFSKEALS